MLRRFYHALPLSPGLRHRIGQWRKRWLRRNLSQPEAALISGASGPDSRLEPAVPGMRDYLFFSVIDWHFRHQRPQQLALATARSGRRVFYVSVNFVEGEQTGLALEKLAPDLPLYQILLRVRGPLNVYQMTPSPEQLRQLKGSLRDLWCAAGIESAISVIQHPFWQALGSAFPAGRTVYDCMDHHAGFSNTATEHAEVERQLLAYSDLTVVTSDYLEAFARPLARRVAMIRNAGDYAHFNQAVALRGDSAEASPRRVIGYYGAIAEWFDVELMDELAQRFADCEFVLIGDDSAGVGRALRHHRHVKMLGEKPYSELPEQLARFDVCLIPFRINELTLATNPVKVYEYLSAGKAVVSTDLPELRQFGDLVYRATGVEAFVAAVRQALDEPAQPQAQAALQGRRMAFAREQTWGHRADMFIGTAEDVSDEPSVSVVVVSYNQWHLTERCLQSLEAHSDGVPLQVIVVDNASRDEAPEGLRAWAAEAPERRLAVLNTENLGFGGGVNAGMAHATGDYVVVLNNDTIVSRGWARGLRRHFERNPKLGLICPITNNIGNEAQVALHGRTPDEVFASAKHYALGRTAELLPLSCAAFFCVMMPRTVWQRVGVMDERFFPGYFEDDDYCLRVRELGLEIGCAEDVFVYHELSATFDQEGQVRRQAIFDRNKKLFEEKWGAWKPHTYRPESLPR